jgi:purine-binding chemotaxis protein CheW
MGSTQAQEKSTFAFAQVESAAAPRLGEPRLDGEEAAMLTREQTQRILRERARALASNRQPEARQEDTLRIVEFFLAHERYAVEAAYVREVQRVKHLTPLPCTPSFVLGIMNVRGHMLSVVDLRVFFDLPQDRSAERDTVVVFRSAELELGVLTDGVVGARSVPLKSIKPVSPGLSGIRREYLRGISEEHLIVLDVEHILSDKRMLVGADEMEF